MPHLLETVALTRDVPEFGLQRGDLGVVVELLSADAFEVEFVLPSGKTRALLSLSASDLRPLLDSDVIAVRSLASHDA